MTGLERQRLIAALVQCSKAGMEVSKLWELLCTHFCMLMDLESCSLSQRAEGVLDLQQAFWQAIPPDDGKLN